MAAVLAAVLAACLLSGCSRQQAEPVAGPPASGARGSTAGGAGEASPAAADGKVTVALTPDNTRIQFVGFHTGDNPNPRTGHFAAFSGQLAWDAAANSLMSVAVEIDTESLDAGIANLTTHLRSPDFFDVREHPTASFQSTEITTREEVGQYTIQGNLTLLGNTRPISFPASIEFQEGALKLNGQFTMDRSEFGMDRLQDRVTNEVEITVTVDASGLDAGGGEQVAGRRGRGSFDAMAVFQRRDADQDGKLTGDEISERMRENLAAIDTDGDGAVSAEEFQQWMQQAGGRRGGRRGADGGGDRQ